MAAEDYIPRGLEPVLNDAMTSARAVAVLGPRQAGKSTLAKEVAAGPLQAEYLTLDDDAVRGAAASDPTGFVARLGATTVIDEIQRVPELLLAIKVRLDNDDRRGQLLLTGSANLRRIPTVADALPGRVDYLTLWPFTQGELARRFDGFLASARSGQPPRISDAPVGRAAYAERILAGGFPEAQHRAGAARGRFFNSYVETIIDRDVASVANIHEPEALAGLLALVAARSGSLARYDALARDLGLSGKTVKSYVEVLERLYLVRVRRPWYVNLGQRQVKAPKLYLSDTGMLARLAGADAGRIESDGGLAGALFETFVATELERQASWMDDPPSFWHYRDSGREVDVIAEWPSGELVGVEVKAAATVRRGDFKGLEYLRDRTGGRLRAGVVVYTGALTLPFGDRLWALPLAGLWQPS